MIEDSSEGGTASLASAKEFLTRKHIFQHSLNFGVTPKNREFVKLS